MHLRAYTLAVAWTAASIKEQREARGWTQQQLADFIGASRRAVIGWEAGESSPQGRFATQLDKVLGPEVEAASPSLANADFFQTVNHLIHLYQQAQRDGVSGLTTDSTKLPPDFVSEHDVSRGPSVTGDESNTATRRRRNSPAE